MSDKIKGTLKNVVYAIVVAALSSMATFLFSRGIAFGTVATQIESISKAVEDHHTKDDLRDANAIHRVITLEEQTKELQAIKADIRDIHNYLLGTKQRTSQR